jgi:hypothetical protein
MYTTHSFVDTITAPTETNAGEGEFLYISGRATELKWLRKEHDVVALHIEYSHFFPLSCSFWTALP